MFSDNCDDELSIEAASSTANEGCTETITRTWTATDNCGNSITVDQVITIVDTTAPVWYSEGYTETVSCGTAYSVSAGEVFELCNGYEVSHDIETINGECEAEFTEIHTFIATDACGNASLPYVVTINYVDNEAPFFTSVPESNEFSCDAIIPNEMPVASDFCSSVQVDMVEEVIEGECANSYVIVRTYTATDACGNVSEPVSVSYYIYDNTNPTVETQLEDLTYDCATEIVPATITVSDNCSDVANITVTPSVETIWSDDCGNGVFVVNYYVVDECGNFSEASYTVTIQDEVAPTLSTTPENLVLACDAQIPAAEVVTASDNCGSEIEVVFIETIVGEQPAEGSIADCNLITPALPAGNPCNYPTAWAMALFNMPTSSRYYVIQSGELVRYPNGTAHVSATLVNAYNSNAGFNVSVWFDSEMDWSSWSNQNFPTSFKADCGGIDANYQDWLYFVLVNGEGAELTGWGEYSGSALNLSHAPSNKYFGFQLGDGANNYNAADNGFGGWFTYSGSFVNANSSAIQTVTGAGDFAFELDCCPEYQIVRCWTAMDCSGNMVEHCQTISFEGSDIIEVINPTTPESTEAEVSKESNVSVYPNPATDQANFEFSAVETGKATIDFYDLAGARVASIYTASVEAGNEYKTTFDAGTLATGVYTYRLTNGSTVEMGRLIISK
jgi:hypothetical protein